VISKQQQQQQQQQQLQFAASQFSEQSQCAVNQRDI
jgi:hypothetical protein